MMKLLVGMKYWTIFLMTLILYCCKDDSQEKLTKKWDVSDESHHRLDLLFHQLTKDMRDTSFFSIIPYDSTLEWVFYTPVTSSKLSPAELILAEQLLQIRAKDWNEQPHLRDTLDDLSKYKRQFVPVINEAGEKEVWANCFCDRYDNGKNWRTRAVNVDDGGPCFFSVILNLTRQTTYKMSVHPSW